MPHTVQNFTTVSHEVKLSMVSWVLKWKTLLHFKCLNNFDLNFAIFHPIRKVLQKPLVTTSLPQIILVIELPTF